MNFTSGMWINGKASNNPPNTTRKNINVTLSKNTGSYSNEDGFTIHSTQYSARSIVPIGYTVIDNGRVVVYSKSNVFSEIGVVNSDGTYRVVSNDLFYNFDVNSPIHGEFYLNAKGEAIVTFTDRDRNPPRIINIDDLTFSFTDNATKLFPDYVEPVIDITENETGGILISGSKQVTGRYVDKEGNRTKWFKLSKPFFITEDTKSEGFDNYDGCAPATETSKSIIVDFQNADLRYPQLEVALLEKIDGIVSVNIVGLISVDANTEISITGSEEKQNINIADILEETASFDRVRTITQLNNRLYLAGVRETSIDDFQKYANNIRLRVTRKKKNQSDFTGSNKTKDGYGEMTFKAGEVVAFYFNFVMLDGTRSRAFLISGRDAANTLIKIDGSPFNLVANERISCLDAYNTGLNLGANLSYLLEDLAIDNTVKYFHTRDTAFNPNATTNFGFFENENEEYPNTDDFLVYDSTGQVGDLRGQKVRHHKFPTIGKMKEIFYPNDPLYGTEFMDILGVAIDANSLYIPQEILDKVQGWEISYAKRTAQNASVIGQDLLFFASNHGPGTQVRSNGGNWTGMNANNGQTQDLLREEARFHCFDLLRYKPATTPSFIRNNIKLIKQSEIYDIQGTYVSNAYKAVLVSDFGKKSHYLQSSGDNRTELPILRDEIRKITNWKYQPNNTIDGTYDNRFLEEYIQAGIVSAQGIKLTTNTRAFVHGAGNINSNTRQFISIDNTQILFGPVEETFLTDICVLKKDMYSSFYSQKLVSTGYVFDKNVPVNNIAVYGGDTFVGFHSFVAFGTRDDNDYDPNASRDGIKAFKRYLCESFSNTEMRYYDPNSDGSYYYPFGGTQGLFVNIGFDYYRDIEPNQFLYNKDYSSINDIVALFPFHPYDEFIVNHDYRIYRSLYQDEEHFTSNWRMIKANDYYEMPKNMGPIINLQGYDDVLIINQKYSSYVTSGNEKLPTTQGEVNLGTGDIFRVVPQQLVTDKNGYAGCQHKYGTYLSKYGFVFIDGEHGKIYMYTKGAALKELSREKSFALHDFFRDGCSGVSDNPFGGSGFSIAFDEKYERLIFSKRKYVINQFGQDLIDGVYGVGKYLRFVTDRWIFVDEGIGLYQIVYEGDERFWDSVSWTVSYSFDFNCWVSFHTYVPNCIFNTRNEVLSFKNNQIYKHNANNKGVYYDQDSIESCYITPTFVSPYRTQERALISALYGSISINTETYDPDGVLIKEKSVSSVTSWNSYQSTGDVDIVEFDPNLTYEQNFLTFNIRNSKNSFTFNKLRDLVIDRKLPFIEDYETVITNIDANKPFYLRRKLIDKFLIVKLLYNNEKIGNLQYDFHFGDIATFTKPSTR